MSRTWPFFLTRLSLRLGFSLRTLSLHQASRTNPVQCYSTLPIKKGVFLPISVSIFFSRTKGSLISWHFTTCVYRGEGLARVCAHTHALSQSQSRSVSVSPSVSLSDFLIHIVVRALCTHKLGRRCRVLRTRTCMLDLQQISPWHVYRASHTHIHVYTNVYICICACIYIGASPHVNCLWHTRGGFTFFVSQAWTWNNNLKFCFMKDIQKSGCNVLDIVFAYRRVSQSGAVPRIC